MLIDRLIELIFSLHQLVELWVLLVLAVQVALLLAAFYVRPVRTARQLFSWLLILFAGVILCCMTVWLFLHKQQGIASGCCLIKGWLPENAQKRSDA